MSQFPANRIAMSAPDITDDDVAGVVEVLRSGQLSIGPTIEAFEESARKYIGTRYAVAVSSGTAALHLCMRMAKVDRGSEVITSPYSFVASSNCVLYEGGTPVFVDIDEETFNIDPAAVEDALTDRTTAVLPIHVFGRPAQMDRLSEIANRRGLALVEDACEAIGAEFNGRKVGTFGHASVFAFYPNKQITTGEGAIITTDDADWYRELCSQRNHGRQGAGWLDHHQLGFNYRLNAMSAALGVSQFSRIESLLARRAGVAADYSDQLAQVGGVSTLRPSVATSMSWFVYIVRLDPHVSRDNVAERLAAQGIPTRNYFPPIHLQPFYVERFGYRRGQFPITERVAASTLALPFHGNMGTEAVAQVCRALAAAIDAEAAPRKSA